MPDELSSTKFLVANSFFCFYHRAVDFFRRLTARPKTRAHLLVTFYRETDRSRLMEYRACVKRNLRNPFIERIHVFYENRADSKAEEFLIHPRIQIHDFESPQNQGITYGHLIDFANQNLAGKTVIIANTDIYFDCSLQALERYDLTNKVLALTRYDCGAYKGWNGKLWSRHDLSQDSWIFRPPLRKFNADIKIGWLGCDNRLAYEMRRGAVHVLNPSLTVKTWHIHKRRLPASSFAHKTYLEEEDFVRKRSRVSIQKLGG